MRKSRYFKQNKNVQFFKFVDLLNILSTKSVIQLWNSWIIKIKLGKIWISHGV